MLNPALNLTEALITVVSHRLEGLEKNAAIAALQFVESILAPEEWDDIPREELIEHVKAEVERLRLES